ncbi:MAG: S8 family serine peptidase [Bacteroidaceae bacterium]|nr:S8 family serine peptidase [Bacteroidaceae bacterium]
MRKVLSLLALFVLALSASAQNNTAYERQTPSCSYRVYLHDKDGNGYSLRHPEKFLSPKALERRAKFGLAVDQYDLPVSKKYLKKLSQAGFGIHCVSKWNNTAVVTSSLENAAELLQALSFVDSVQLVYVTPDSLEVIQERDEIVPSSRRPHADSRYGYATRQAEMIGADRMHEAGFIGDGITIAVIDGGFHNADRIPGLDNVRILGTRNFVHPDRDVYLEGSHGMMVLSCIGSNKPGLQVGTAPGASFYLLLSEDGSSEFPIEEDNWCAAIEYADSLGCDIVTSSLGYTQFDDKSMSHRYYELDGHTYINSRSASLAASRGLVVLNSAGNSGNDRWKLIGAPADAENMLAVGAVDPQEQNTLFSSLGNSADGRIKPDVMAQGQHCSVFDTDGTIRYVAGTSFSCPILCGGVACLMQASPDATPLEIIRAIRLSGDRADHPDNVFGYGIPDLWRAYEILHHK